MISITRDESFFCDLEPEALKDGDLRRELQDFARPMHNIYPRAIEVENRILRAS